MTTDSSSADAAAERLHARLRELTAVLGPARPFPPDVPPGDAHAAMNAAADRLLDRVAVLSAELKANEHAPLDDVDAVLARVLIGDLSLTVGAWRSLGGNAASQLDTAAATLDEARAIVNQTLRTLSDEARTS
jgi:hypothetical protein